MSEKFLGLGLVNLIGIWFLYVIFSAGAKVIASKYQIPGLSELILTGA